MNSKTTISITEARKNIFKIVNEVSESGQYYTLTEKGKPKAVLMSVDEFESWIETFEVMKDIPDLDKDIKQARENYAKGDYITLEELMAEKGFTFADKKNKYEISSNPTKKRSKRLAKVR